LVAVREIARHLQANRTYGVTILNRMKPSLNGLADLKHTRCLNDGRLPLPFGKLGSFGAVGVNTGKSFSVFVKNRNLPMFMLAASVLPQLGAFSFFQCLYPHLYYLN
jgi:hypothetical protein